MSAVDPRTPAFTPVSFRAPFDPPRRFPRRIGRKPFWALIIAVLILLGTGRPGIVLLVIAAAATAAFWWWLRRQTEAAAAGLTGYLRSFYPDAPGVDRAGLLELLDRGRLIRSAEDGTEIALRLARPAASGGRRPVIMARYRPAGFGLPEFDDALRTLGSDPQVARAIELLRKQPRA